MKFLVIGSSGFIGGHLLTYLKALGHETIGTQCDAEIPGLVSFDLKHHRVEDRINGAFFTGSERVYAVICASICQIDQCAQAPEASYRVNVAHTCRLIDDLTSLGVKSVFVSSSFVFDGKDGYYCEENGHSPICEYGRHKAAVEDFIRTNGYDVLIFRLDKVVGDDPSEKHLFFEWYQRVVDNQPIFCIDGQLFSPTRVDDVARAVVLACEMDLTGLYHVANTEYFTRAELAKQFVRELNQKTEIIGKPQQDFNFLDLRPLKSYLDSTKFITATDFRFISMRETMRSFISRVNGAARYIKGSEQ